MARKMQYMLLVFLLLGTTSSLLAQGGGTVLINTEFDEPYKNTWNGAAFVGLDIQAKSSGGIYYGAAARYTLAKIATFSANIGLDLTSLTGSGSVIKTDEELTAVLPSYKNIELRGTFHFKDEEGQKTHKVNLGSDGRYEYSTSYTSKSRVVRGITASVNILSRAYVQSVDSIHVLEIKDRNSGTDLGYVNGVATGQNNVMLGVGFHMGEYTFYKGKFTGGAGGTTKTRRFKRALNTQFELLFAPAIIASKEAYKKVNGTLETYTLEKADKKNLGFRIAADIYNGKPGMYMRVEFGTRPGIKAPLKLDSKIGKFLTNGYFAMSFGLSI